MLFCAIRLLRFNNLAFGSGALQKRCLLWKLCYFFTTVYRPTPSHFYFLVKQSVESYLHRLEFISVIIGSEVPRFMDHPVYQNVRRKQMLSDGCSCVAMYKRMINNRKYGLTYSLMASKVLPVLIPHCVNPALDTHQVLTNGCPRQFTNM